MSMYGKINKNCPPPLFGEIPDVPLQVSGMDIVRNMSSSFDGQRQQKIQKTSASFHSVYESNDEFETRKDMEESMQLEMDEKNWEDMPYTKQSNKRNNPLSRFASVPNVPLQRRYSDKLTNTASVLSDQRQQKSLISTAQSFNINESVDMKTVENRPKMEAVRSGKRSAGEILALFSKGNKCQVRTADFSQLSLTKAEGIRLNDTSLAPSNYFPAFSVFREGNFGANNNQRTAGSEDTCQKLPIFSSYLSATMIEKESFQTGLQEINQLPPRTSYDCRRKYVYEIPEVDVEQKENFPAHETDRFRQRSQSSLKSLGKLSSLTSEKANVLKETDEFDDNVHILREDISQKNHVKRFTDPLPDFENSGLDCTPNYKSTKFGKAIEIKPRDYFDDSTPENEDFDITSGSRLSHPYEPVSKAAHQEMISSRSFVTSFQDVHNKPQNRHQHAECTSDSDFLHSHNVTFPKSVSKHPGSLFQYDGLSCNDFEHETASHQEGQSYTENLLSPVFLPVRQQITGSISVEAERPSQLVSCCKYFVYFLDGTLTISFLI